MFFPSFEKGYTRIRNAKTGKYHSMQSGRYLDIIRKIYDNPETVVYVPRSEVVDEDRSGVTDLTRFMSRIRRSTGLDVTAYCVAPEGQRPYGDNVIGYEIKLNKA
tara:strand:- start:2086 stop:2400 length:315 start_codon:yes stop_codon:yes gene_type:complete